MRPCRRWPGLRRHSAITAQQPRHTASRARQRPFNSPLSANNYDENLANVATANGWTCLEQDPRLPPDYGCPTRHASRRSRSDRPRPRLRSGASTSMAWPKDLAGAARRKGKWAFQGVHPKTVSFRSSLFVPTTNPINRPRPILGNRSNHQGRRPARIVPMSDHRDHLRTEKDVAPDLRREDRMRSVSNHRRRPDARLCHLRGHGRKAVRTGPSR